MKSLHDFAGEERAAGKRYRRAKTKWQAYFEVIGMRGSEDTLYRSMVAAESAYAHARAAHISAHREKYATGHYYIYL